MPMNGYQNSLAVLQRNRKVIPGGVSSVNRIVEPAIAFSRGDGAYIWDADGNRYLDFHAAFAPHFLGHNFEPAARRVREALADGDSLFGSGPSAAEGRLAELLCSNIGWLDQVSILNTGSEATSAAVRLSRAITGRDHLIVMQGGYNGNGDSLACNLMDDASQIGARVCPGEYPLCPYGAGTTLVRDGFTHAINFNDLESVRYVCERYPVSCLITEPVLQNIGIVAPQAGYLAGLRRLADEYGFLLIFDEVKTGFRHAFGGYAEISGVVPDLTAYGKAIASGFPLAILGGKEKWMQQIVHPDKSKRPFIAGTYNGHPVAVAAAIATIEYLLEHRSDIYRRMERVGARIQQGIEETLQRRGITGVVSRQGSAFVLYFMDHLPRDWHDVRDHHDFELDVAFRRALIDQGVYFVPIAVKQCSISMAHSDADIELTLKKIDETLHVLKQGP
jgi:glutamate-1-semialdehyde 2,1-aminomutase